MNPPTILNASGDSPESRSLDVKRFLFDWAGVFAIAGGAMVWATTASNVASNTREIERLRIANEARGVADVRIASEMATKSDVQRVSDQVQALSVELRNARLGQ